MTTFATLFSGGELVGVGARMAGLTPIWGIEIDPAIAGVAHANGFDGTICADALTIDPHTLAVPNVLHASPVCTRASQANSSAELNEDGLRESPVDVALGEKVAQFIDVMRPRVFTLENVYGYRKFKAFSRITAALSRNGYFWDYDNLNSADYGVPQTRRRLILRAVLGSLLPHLPLPEKWNGWYAAIEDLIPTLPESAFAPWQLARLPELFRSTSVERHGAFNLQDQPPQMREVDEPSWTVRASERQLESANAFIMSNSKTEYSDGVRVDADPALSRTAQQGGRLRAFIMPGGGNTNFGEAEPGRGVRFDDEPSLVVSPVTSGGGSMPRAFIVDCQDSASESGLTVGQSDEPTFTVSASVTKRPARAFIVDSQLSNGGEALNVIDEQSPMATVRTGLNHMAGVRAWLSRGRVVSMTDRCLARFQSIPDSYVLPAKKSLSCRVIGNAVPPLWYQKIITPMVQG